MNPDMGEEDLRFEAMNQFLTKRPFLFFSLLLILKSALAYLVIFETPASWLWKPLLNELPFIWILFCLIEFFSAKRKILLYMIVNLLLTGLFFAVIMYYQYYGVIVTYHALDQVNQVTAVSNSVFSLLHPYYLLIFTDIVVLILMAFRNRNRKMWRNLGSLRMPKSVTTVVFVLSLSLCLFQVLPNRASMNEIKKAEEMGILNYEAFTLLADEKKEKPVDKEAITQQAVNELKGINEPADPQFHGAAAGKNLIIIQMESFQNFLIDLKLDGQEVTPNMNKLAHENFYFNKFYQQVGQGNTSDAEFVVNSSFYVPPHGAASGEYVDKELPSQPRLFEANGYDTATFHTNIVEFWNRGELYKALGWNRYYDQQFFGDEDKIFFGSSDEVLYRKTSEKLKEMDDSGKPFYAQLISLSAHHPFTIPERKYKMTLPERYEGTMVGDYVRAQNYADYALGQFIDTLKANGVWQNSLIVVYGDHVGLPKFSLDSKEAGLMKEIYGRDYDYSDMINIPLIIAGDGVTSPRTFDQVGGQVDVLPTVANLMGFSLDGQLHFGEDILNQPYNLLPQRYYLPSGSMISGEVLFIPGNDYDDGTQYPLKGTDSGSTDITEDEYRNALDLLRYSDSYIRQLPDREQPAE
nr:LTA synthase family protein [Cohnella sp. YIM B05605]